ncbi:protein of unknown function [Petrocella atlantisensis]|uniref:Uncharacterized protein n=1 Tax=Petrocella atlantisensis TaxID=2173034 RepID=A0A3P7NZT2_9FIRM|nr:protein of unknown function [Petrocella atlantisensis]
MRLKVVNSKNVQLLYVIETIYVDGKQKTRTVEKLGRYSDLEKKLNGANPIEWAKSISKILIAKKKNKNVRLLSSLGNPRLLIKRFNVPTTVAIFFFNRFITS